MVADFARKLAARRHERPVTGSVAPRAAALETSPAASGALKQAD
jgi:hypothetical protein